MKSCTPSSIVLLGPVLETAAMRGEPAIIVTISGTHGSSPRETGAVMIVTKAGLHGTIGGGQLEYHATDKAREMLSLGLKHLTLPLTLGPQMGQCCGGRVVLDLREAKAEDNQLMAARDAEIMLARPHVLIFGAGHTGRALASQMALLPMRTTLVDDRPFEMAMVAADVERQLLENPEIAVHEANPGSAFVVMTHSHALDYRLTEAALRRNDAAYVGLIGSATKRARFLAGLKRGGDVDLAVFACPIGGTAIGDKRPEMIAALTVAELVRALIKGVANTVSSDHGTHHVA